MLFQWKRWSRIILLNRTMLWVLFVVNAFGTIYGFMWYGNQLQYTFNTMEPWLVLFVPDSPTASLFFTFALLILLWTRSSDGTQKKRPSGVMRWMEAMAAVTLVKYGIWAVVMIFAGEIRGNELQWQDWMLVCSHLGMALQAVLYTRFFSFGFGSLVLVTIWTISNDLIDYQFHVFPWLPKELAGDMHWIPWFTFFLGLGSIALITLLSKRR